ncbi:hypothetical protein [Falsiroseomonas oryzae]|uniref:hypothetical protein n=1 Tax=Falsiroseomonas oryzae TaxID=2766473 RepID=UPI0022EB5591|nr:hypothetical protein [Roseomonas sp. MO-31]
MSPAPRAIRATGAVLGAAVALGVVALHLPAAAETRPTVLSLDAELPASAVYLDESFFADVFRGSGGLAGHLAALRYGAGSAQGFRAALVTVAAGRIDWHDPIAFVMARTGPAPRTDVAFGPNGHRPFDIAIMTDCGGCPPDAASREAYLARIRRDAEIVRRHGAQPVLFMAWTDRDRPERLAQMADSYTLAGNATGALVIPAGLAFARALAQRPGLALHEDDQRHPTLAGTYLAAAITYAALYGTSPVGNRYTAGLDAETGAFLQRVAWETAWQYYAGRPPE